MSDERRVDPDDGQAYTYAELTNWYKGKFKKTAIDTYWADSCRLVKAKGKSEAKSKAKAHAKERNSSNKDNADEKNQMGAQEASAVDLKAFKKGRTIQVKSADGVWFSARVVKTEFPNHIKVVSPGKSDQWITASCTQARNDIGKENQLNGAACNNDFKKISKLLDGGHSPSWGNECGQTPLHIASMWGNWQCVKALLHYRADVNAVNSAELGGNSPLHMLVKSDMSEAFDEKVHTASLLIQARADVHATNDSDVSAINLACDIRLREALSEMVEPEKLLVHKAVRQRNTKDLQSILERISLGELPRSLLSSLNCNEQTPLHCGVHCGDFEVVKLLLEASVDIHAYEADLNNDFRYASRSFQRDPMKHATALHICSTGGNVLMMQMLLEAEADVNARDSFGCTPLHVCLSSSEDPNCGPSTGVRVTGSEAYEKMNGKLGSIVGTMTAPPACSGCADPGCDNESVKSEDVDYRVLVDVTPPHEIYLKEDSFSYLYQEAIDVLLDARADVNVGNNKSGMDQSVLHTAAHAGNEALARKIINARANVNMQRENSGQTPLHLAIRGRRLDLIHLLLGSRADVNLASRGKTALQLGALNGLHIDDAGILQTGCGQPNPPSAVEQLSESERAALYLD